MSTALNELCGCDFAYELRCVNGRPVSASLEGARAEHADVVAVGTHGRAGFDRLVVGSVAAGVIQHNDADTRTRDGGAGSSGAGSM